ncbi:MAG: deoxynucleoside kinase [Cyclobacteriaceae bacterium]
MIKNLRHIAIAGNIGAGKTTLTTKLAKHYGWVEELESVDENPYLRDFYEDMEKWSFHLQVYFLNSRFQQIKRVRMGEDVVIQDRTIYEDAHIFAKSLYGSGKFNEKDYQTYFALYQSMIEFVNPPDLLIYLRADIPKLVENIEKRGRVYENAIRLDYLKNLNRHYEEWIRNYDHGRLLIINMNNVDFVDNTDDFSNIVQLIDRELNGLFSS